MSFTNNKYDYPFPVLIENLNNDSIVFSGPSIFNLTLSKPEYFNLMVFNMNPSKSVKKDKIEVVNYNPTPFLPSQTIGFLIGMSSRDFEYC